MRPEVLTRLAMDQFVHVVGQFPLEIPPCEIGVGLGEAGLREEAHHLRPGKGLGQEDDFRMPLLHAPDEPFPERHGLGVGVVDAEDGDALVDPEQHHVTHLFPQGGRVGTVEIDVDDVLVLLGRVLGVTDRAVGPPQEPFGMLADVGMVGGALDGEVERHLHSHLPRADHEAPEIIHGAKVRMHGLVAALGAADGVGTAGVVRARDEGVVGPLAMHPPNGMNWQQVDDVEAHLFDGGEAGLAIGEGGAARRVASLRPRHDFVPGGEARGHSIHHHFHLAVVAHRPAAVRVTCHDLPQQGGVQKVETVAVVFRCGIVREQSRQPFSVCRVGAPQRRLDQRPALLQFDRDRLARLPLLRGVVPPGLEGVRPGLDRIEIAPVPFERETAHPAVVVEGAIATSRQPDDAPSRYRTTAASRSCPSLRMSADTSSMSPTSRLTGNRPQSTCGLTSSMMIGRLPSPAITVPPAVRNPSVIPPSNTFISSGPSDTRFPGRPVAPG